MRRLDAALDFNTGAIVRGEVLADKVQPAQTRVRPPYGFFRLRTKKESGVKPPHSKGWCHARVTGLLWVTCESHFLRLPRDPRP